MYTPYYRPRRLRNNEAIRNMVRETNLSVNDLIMPLFVVEGKNVRNPISSMPGNDQLSIDLLVKEVKELKKLGVPAIILFGIPEHKDAIGSDATSEHGIIQKAIKAHVSEPDGPGNTVQSTCSCATHAGWTAFSICELHPAPPTPTTHLNDSIEHPGRSDLIRIPTNSKTQMHQGTLRHGEETKRLLQRLVGQHRN